MSRSWSSGLFGCFDPLGTCCLGFWCPCFLYGKIMDKKKNPSAETSGLNGSCCGWYALSCCGLQCLIQLGTRGEIRNRYNIEGSGVKDFLATWCCPCCSLTQEYKELKAHDSMNVAGAAVGYQSQPAGGMTYAAPPVQGKVG